MAYNINDKNNICTLVKNYTLPWFWKCSHDDFQSFESLKLRKLSLKKIEARSWSKNAFVLFVLMFLIGEVATKICDETVKFDGHYRTAKLYRKISVAKSKQLKT